MSAATASPGARRFPLVSAVALPLALAADLAGLPRRTVVVLALTSAGLVVGLRTVAAAGTTVSPAGGLVHLYVLTGLFRER